MVLNAILTAVRETVEVIFEYLLGWQAVAVLCAAAGRLLDGSGGNNVCFRQRRFCGLGSPAPPLVYEK